MSDTTWGSEGCTAMYGKRSRHGPELAIPLRLRARAYRECRHLPADNETSVVQRELARKQPENARRRRTRCPRFWPAARLLEQ